MHHLSGCKLSCRASSEPLRMGWFFWLLWLHRIDLKSRGDWILETPLYIGCADPQEVAQFSPALHHYSRCAFSLLCNTSRVCLSFLCLPTSSWSRTTNVCRIVWTNSIPCDEFHNCSTNVRNNWIFHGRLVCVISRSKDAEEYFCGESSDRTFVESFEAFLEMLVCRCHVEKRAWSESTSS